LRMTKRLSIKCRMQPALVLYRRAFRDTKLVYVARANKPLRYLHGRSRIAYIGMTKRGARRIASSAVWKGAELLFEHGVKQLDFHGVVCGKVPGVGTWKKLERALIIRSSGNTSKPASRGHFKTGQSRVADDSGVAVHGDEARLRWSGDSGAQPSPTLSPLPGCPRPAAAPRVPRGRSACRQTVRSLVASAGARGECKRRDRAARARCLLSPAGAGVTSRAWAAPCRRECGSSSDRT